MRSLDPAEAAHLGPSTDAALAQVAALRRGLFEVIPKELFSVFDHNELGMLLNGHHSANEDTVNSSKVFV